MGLITKIIILYAIIAVNKHEFRIFREINVRSPCPSDEVKTWQKGLRVHLLFIILGICFYLTKVTFYFSILPSSLTPLLFSNSHKELTK